MTTAECISLATGFIFCVPMLADMKLVQWHLSKKTPFAALLARLTLKSKNQTTVSG